MHVDDIIAFKELGGDVRKRCDWILKIGIHHDGIVSVTGLESCAEGGVLSVVPAEVDDSDVLSLVMDFLHDVQGVILASVVDKDKLHLEIMNLG